jgi:hypothetical protein
MYFTNIEAKKYEWKKNYWFRIFFSCCVVSGAHDKNCIHIFKYYSSVIEIETNLTLWLLSLCILKLGWS